MPANLGDLTYFGNRSLGGISADEESSQRGQNLIAALNSYGANAQYKPSYGSDGQLLGYSLYYDPTKLPGANGSGQLGGSNVASDGSYAGGSAPITPFSTVGDRMQLVNPNAVYNSPIYGKITDNSNIATPASWVDTYGPMIIGAMGMLAPMAFGAAGLGMGSAGAAQAAIGGANGGLAATEGGVSGLGGLSTPFASAVGKGLPNVAQSAANHNFNPVSLIPYGGAAFGLPSWLTTGATTLGNLARGAKLNFNPVQLAIAATQLGRGTGGQ